MQYLKILRKDYHNIDDLVEKKVKRLYIFYFETLCDQDKISEYILKFSNAFRLPKDIKKILPSPNIKDIKSYKELKDFLENGFTIILDKSKAYAVETRINITRAVESPSTEPTLYGPKESLNENYQTNLGLIKRRIKSSHLKDKSYIIGRYTKTKVTSLYIDSIAKKDLIIEIDDSLKKIDIDGINDIGELKKYLNKDNSNFFPAIKITERPDTISKALLDGKIIILMDTSPYALILPAFLVDFINPISDDYTKNINVNFLKILRLLALFISIITPSLYIAITCFNQETIPTNLLINFQTQRLKIPFPSIVECLITLITCELLRESDIRFPSKYGSAISILGGLVLGESAVAAGLISPIMIIIIAITFISSMIFSDLEIMNAIRAWRFIFLIFAALFGLYGECLAFVLFISNLASYENYDKPYLFPIAPFDLNYIKETVFKMKNNKRSKMLSKNTIKGDK